jgi:hypothetical protein
VNCPFKDKSKAKTREPIVPITFRKHNYTPPLERESTPFMGLQAFKGERPVKSEVTVAKKARLPLRKTI